MYRLINITLLECRLERSLSYQFNNEKFKTHLDIKIGKNIDDAKLVSELTVLFTGGEGNSTDEYNDLVVMVKYGALFEFKNLKKEEIEDFAEINAPAILYPYVRQTVSELISRTNFPQMHLPIVNFVTLFEQNTKKKEIISE